MEEQPKEENKPVEAPAIGEAYEAAADSGMSPLTKLLLVLAIPIAIPCAVLFFAWFTCSMEP